METYKQIVDWPWYSISDLGNVKSVWSTTTRKPSKRPYGYLNVTLSSAEGIKKGFYVHRLVAEAFVPNPHSLPTVDHIDGNPANNSADNLRWCTQADNLKSAIVRRGKHWRKGEQNPTRWIAYAAIDEQGNKLKFSSLREAGEHFSKKYTTFAPMINHSIKHMRLAYGHYWSKA
jgi:hypothetical protein